LKLLALLVPLILATPALAAPVDDYVQLSVALGINQACGGLKYFEHSRALAAAGDALSGTTEHRLSLDSRLSQDQYDAWFAPIQAEIDAKVAEIGCTQAANPYLQVARGKASQTLYQGLVLAFHFASLPDIDLNHIPLDTLQQRAMQNYDFYLQQLYGANFQAFSDQQKQLAAQQLPPVDTYSGLMGAFSGLDAASIAQATEFAWNARSAATSAIDAVTFEVTAETAGQMVRPLSIGGRWTIPQLRQPDGSQLPVVEGPSVFPLDRNLDDSQYERLPLHYVAVLMPDRSLRLMFYGEAAGTEMDQATVRLYIRNAPLPPAVSSWTMFNRDDWRQDATGFSGVRLTEPCLGGPCYSFPPQATDMLVAFNEGDYAELFVSAKPDDDTDVPGALRMGRFSNFYTYKLVKTASAQATP